MPHGRLVLSRRPRKRRRRERVHAPPLRACVCVGRWLDSSTARAHRDGRHSQLPKPSSQVAATTTRAGYEVAAPSDTGESPLVVTCHQPNPLRVRFESCPFLLPLFRATRVARGTPRVGLGGVVSDVRRHAWLAGLKASRRRRWRDASVWQRRIRPGDGRAPRRTPPCSATCSPSWVHFDRKSLQYRAVLLYAFPKLFFCTKPTHSLHNGAISILAIQHERPICDPVFFPKKKLKSMHSQPFYFPKLRK